MVFFLGGGAENDLLRQQSECRAIIVLVLGAIRPRGAARILFPARTEFRSLALLFSLPNQLSGLKLTQDEEADHEIHYLIIFSHHPNELVCGDFAQNLIACLRQFM